MSATADTSYTAPTHAQTILSAAPIAVSSVTTTSGSQLVTIASGTFSASVGPQGTNTQAWVAGMQVYGTGVPVGTTVLYVNGTNAYLSQAATASGTVTLTAVSNGIRIEEIDFVGTGTTVAGVVQTYLYDGSVYHPHYSQLVTVVTPSTTVAPAYYAVQYDNLELLPGWSLLATSFVASQLMSVTAFGGSL